MRQIQAGLALAYRDLLKFLRDPVRQDQETWSRLTRERTGPAGPGTRGRSFLPHTDKANPMAAPVAPATRTPTTSATTNTST